MITVLAIESSALVAGIAGVNEEKVTAEYNVNLKLTHSQTLLPMLDEVVKMTGTDLSQIDAIAVSGGPGSFTGLRIGSATAKGLGLALKKPIVAVPTTQGLAMNIFGFDGLICPIMDARRDQVYTGIYRNTREGFSVVSDQEATGIREIVGNLNSLGEKVIFLGDGVPVFKSVIEECAKVPFSFAPENLMVQRAGSLGLRGIQLFKEGKAVNAADHAPDYLRPSQAERVRNEASKHDD